MISRFLELQLTSFRAFNGKQVIPLDADVILIHGQNGTAKTSLLAGLEFALTGGVCDLQTYSDDYPRCLKHHGATENLSATIRFRDADGTEQSITHLAAAAGTSPPLPASFTPEDKRFFVDRCYLSQSSLSRLLENYQACDKEQPEQPLVRFVRELLGLDLLENLTSGLYEAGNITRIEKNVPRLREARETEARTIDRLSRTKARRLELAAVWNTALANLRVIVGEVGDPAPDSPWDITGIKLRLESVDESKDGRSVGENLQKLRHYEGRLQGILGLLGDEEDVSERTNFLRQIEEAESKHTKLHSRLENTFARAEAILLDLGLETPKFENLASNINAATTSLIETRDRLEAEASSIAEASGELSRLRTKAVEKDESLAGYAPSDKSEIAARQRLVELLTAISQHVHGEECPVCRRDYSELKSGSLGDCIASEIAKIGLDTKTFEERELQRAKLELEKADITRRITALEEKVAAKQPIIERLSTHRQSLALVVEECHNARPDCQDLANLQATIAGLRSNLETLELRSKQRTTASESLIQLASELGLTSSATGTKKEIGSLISTHLSAEIEVAERRHSGSFRLRAALNNADKAGQELAALDEELKNITDQYEQSKILIQQMRGLIQEGKNLGKVAASAKQKLLDQVFNDTLNRLWQDFFRRLAKNERFHPWLGEPTLHRGQIRTTIEGRAETGDPFSQFAAVASSGNVSTAALSLFLALHLIEQPRHRVLVLDDPVQNMDDVHVVQLAGLLREIGRTAQRQIVVAVHERALFDYLCLELSPTHPAGKLLALELQRNRPDEAPTVISTEHTWKGDQLKFG